MDESKSPEYVIVACGTLSLELNHLKETGRLNAREILYTTPGLHQAPAEFENKKEILEGQK